MVNLEQSVSGVGGGATVTPKILVVDDRPENRLSLNRVLGELQADQSTLAHTLGLGVIAEEAESVVQMDFPQSVKGHRIQGFSLTPPLSEPMIPRPLKSRLTERLGRQIIRDTPLLLQWEERF